MGPRLGMNKQRFCNRGMCYEEATAMNEQARKIRLKILDDQFCISGLPHTISGCPEDKDT